MKISYHWLKDLIDIHQSPEEIAALLTGCGLEVEGIEAYESIKGGLEGIVIGEVRTRIKHPNADKLSVTTVNIGGPADVQIVCGAPNVDAGQKVLVATVGSTVHPTKGEPFKINKSKIRGEVSEGMICAEDELGLGENHDGILVLPAEYEAGRPAIDYFPVYRDYTIEIGLTANRGDATSHLGVARDLKAITGAALKPLDAPALASYKKAANAKNIAVEIADHEGCKRYSGITITGITVKESPDWLKERLRVIGLSPINNIVDATNYVMHELGQPMHAFDADQLAGQKIIVKKAEAGSTFVTLDKVERKLSGNECMICDAGKPVAIAGVFGGLYSGITTDTKNIFLESAYFDPASVRKTARHHGLSTDASFRFERGTDPDMTVKALERITHIILDIAGGEVASDLVDIYPREILHTTVSFSLGRFNRLIGQEIPKDEVKRIITALDIKIVQETDEQLTLSVPPYRPDVKREADIAEEVLRIYGLNKIAIPSQVRSSLVSSVDELQYILRNKVADYLSATGFSELVNNSLTRSSDYSEEELKLAVKILNPLSNDLDIMRMSMLFSGLDTIQYNRNRRSTDLKLYEFGYTYRQKKYNVIGTATGLLDKPEYDETAHFALFLCGMKTTESWTAPQKPVSYFTLKSVLENLLRTAGIRKYTFAYPGEHAVFENHTQLLSGDAVLAEFGAVNDAITAKRDIDDTVYYADVNWRAVLQAAAKARIQPGIVSPFPQVRRDLALLLDRAVQYAEIERIALKTEPKLIRSIHAFDVYEGDKIAAGKKSYAVSFTLQDEQKTLTDQEIENVMGRLTKAYEQQLGASLRA